MKSEKANNSICIWFSAYLTEIIEEKVIVTRDSQNTNLHLLNSNIKIVFAYQENIYDMLVKKCKNKLYRYYYQMVHL